MLAKLINEKLADKEKRDQQSEEYEQFAISSEIELEDRLLEKEQEEQCESSDEDDTEVASGQNEHCSNERFAPSLLSTVQEKDTRYFE